MMNFLALVASKVVEFFLTRLFTWARDSAKEQAEKKATEEELKAKAQRLNDAKTGEEIDDASDDLLNRV